MVNDLKYFNGSVQPISRIPEALKNATPLLLNRSMWLIEAASRRQKWIDKRKSLNFTWRNFR